MATPKFSAMSRERALRETRKMTAKWRLER